MEKTIGFELRSTSNQLKRHINSLPTFQQNDLRGGCGYVLGFLYLHRNEDVFQKDIEEEIGIRKSSVTSLINTLEKNGLISREQTKSDGRYKKVVLTSKGVEVHEEVMKELNRTEQILKSDLSEEDIEKFFELLDKIKANIEKI